MTQIFGADVVIATAVFMVFLGALAFFARPGGTLNRVLGALFLLTGASNLMFQLMRQAPTEADASVYHAVGHWYEAAIPFLTLLLLHILFPPAPGRARWRVSGLVLAGALTLLLTPFVVGDAVFPDPSAPGFRGFIPEEGAWATAFLTGLWLVRIVVLVAAARVASSASRSALQRRQAGLVGLAFLFLSHVIVSRLARPLLGGDPADLLVPTAALWLAAFAASVYALPRLVQPFEGRARVAAAVAGLSPFAFGVADVLLGALPGYLSSRFLMGAAHAAPLALAVVRYDIAGLGSRAQRRVEVFSRAMLAAAALLLPMGVVLAFLGSTTAGLLVAAALGAGALAISPMPARALARSFARAFTPDPDDPAVAAERARLYADALARHPLGAPELSRLRDDLGLAESDHLALSRMLAQHGQASPQRQPPLLGRYLVERELGQGSTGTALLALDVATGRKVALKRFHAGSEKRARSEAEALARVRSPRVVPLLATERAGDETFLVLAYAEGGSAEDRLRAEGPLPPAKARALALDVLEGLDAIHAAGIAHGDVKPANVLLDADGRALLADLGAAQALGRGDVDVTLTATPFAGTYATVAPEVLRGGRRSAAADVYSTGALLYRLLTGEDYVAMRDRDVFGVTEAILHERPRLPHPRVPPAVEPILARALAKLPAERHAGARQMRDALAAATLAEAAEAAPAPDYSTLPTSGERHPAGRPSASTS